MLFLSTDGQALEGPSSSLIARLRGVLVTPPASVGVLAGTTQADLFTFAAELGVPTEVRPITASELYDVEALWLTSSGRLAAPIRSLDGRPVPVDGPFTRAANRHLLGRG